MAEKYVFRCCGPTFVLKVGNYSFKFERGSVSLLEADLRAADALEAVGMEHNFVPRDPQRVTRALTGTNSTRQAAV